MGQRCSPANFPNVQEEEPFLEERGDQGSFNFESGKRGGIEIFAETVPTSKECNLERETNKGKGINEGGVSCERKLWGDLILMGHQFLQRGREI